MVPPRKVSPAMPLKRQRVAQINTVVSLYKAGRGVKDIAKSIGQSERNIRRLLNAGGISRSPGRPKKLLDSEVERVYDLLSKGSIDIDVAASKLRVSTATIRRVLKEREDATHG